MLFDTHAHYDDDAFDADREALLASLPARGVGRVLNPGCSLSSSRAAVALAEQFPHVWAAVGLHPSDAEDEDDAALTEIRALAAHPRVKAIGEIGLDYHWAGNPARPAQHRRLRRQLELARELKLPVIIHDREAHADTLAIVREYPDVRGVFHCYSGSAEEAKVLLSLGWNLSFTGAVTFPGARRAREVLAMLPDGRFMIETDAPYMLPYPRAKGERRCDSTLLPRVTACIAEIRGTTPEAIEQLTAETAEAFFDIS